MKVTAIVVGVLALVLGGGAAWLGMFGKVTVAEADQGPYAFVYVQEPSVDFGKIGEITKELDARLELAGIGNRKPAQLYYPAGRGIQNQIGFVVDKAMGQDVLGITTFFRNIPAQRYVVARFPFRNPLSFIAGHLRVASKLAAYRKAHGIPETNSMVILDGDTILYLQPVTP